MFRSYSLGKIAGIDLKVHSTFLLLVAFFVLVDGLDNALWTLMELGLVFTIVVLHELGHAMAARRLGIPTRDILLTPIGGIASLARMPARPQDELFITAAGPAVNVVLAALFWPLAILVAPYSPVTAQIFYELFIVNVVLAGFDLIPAFPMDGGRVLRALLTLKSGDFVRSTRTAARVGRALAFGFGLAGLFFNPMLCVIGVFVWLAATAEEASVSGGPMGVLLNVLLKRQAAPHPNQPAQPPTEVPFSRPTCHRRQSVVVDGEYTVV